MVDDESVCVVVGLSVAEVMVTGTTAGWVAELDGG